MSVLYILLMDLIRSICSPKMWCWLRRSWSPNESLGVKKLKSITILFYNYQQTNVLLYKNASLLVKVCLKKMSYHLVTEKVFVCCPIYNLGQGLLKVIWGVVVVRGWGWGACVQQATRRAYTSLADKETTDNYHLMCLKLNYGSAIWINTIPQVVQ